MIKTNIELEEKEWFIIIPLYRLQQYQHFILPNLFNFLKIFSEKIINFSLKKNFLFLTFESNLATRFSLIPLKKLTDLQKFRNSTLFPKKTYQRYSHDFSYKKKTKKKKKWIEIKIRTRHTVVHPSTEGWTGDTIRRKLLLPKNSKGERDSSPSLDDV